MNTKKVILAMGTAASLWAGVTASNAYAAGPVGVPITGAITYQVTPTPPGSTECPIPSMLVGTGTMSHLGKVAVVSTSCAVLVNGVFQFISSTITVTAANGDMLSGTFAGGFYPTGNGSIYELRTATSPSGTLIFTSGTGRFTNVFGELALQATQDFATGQGTASFTGTISYPH